jgi:cation transport regulator
LHGQEIFLSAFKNAWQTCADRGFQEREEVAFRVAWAAVKWRYRKHGEIWIATGI